jgi:proline dehydrogenase
MGLLHSLVSLSLPLVPKPIVARVAKPYVAGDNLEAAIPTLEALNQKGIAATLALLGEEVTELGPAQHAVEEYVRILDLIAERGLDVSISIKLTLLGLKVDEEKCWYNLLQVVEAAHRHGNFVRVDMEDHPCTDATLRMVRETQAKYGNVGTVLQAYLHRTLDDIAHHLPEQDPRIRLCKGIYIEPEEIAYHGYDQIRAKFLEALDALFDRDVHVGIATHDRYLVDEARKRIRERSVPTDRYEFQTLLGVTEGLRDELVAEGHAVRVYVPYGADWYAYSVRRLRENPKIALYVMKAMLGLD